MRKVRSEAVLRFVALAAAALVLAVGSRALFAQEPQKPAPLPEVPGYPQTPGGARTGGDASAKPSAPPALEELLTRALKDNPDIRVAETKLREAEAELNRIRLLVMQKVVAYQHDLDMATRTLDEAKARFQTVEKLHKSASVSMEEFRLAAQAVARFEGERAKIEAELPYLLGKQPVRSVNPPPVAAQTVTFTEGSWDIELKLPARDRANQLRQALDTPVKVEAKEVPLKAFLESLERKAPGIHFVLASTLASGSGPISLQFSESVPLAAVLQAVEDDRPVHFVVRDYGVLVTTQPPAGAMSVHEFWKSKAAKVTHPPAP